MNPADHPLPPRTWADASPALLAAASEAIDAGRAPEPMLIAFAGEEAQAVVTLRPFGPEEVLRAFVEVLSLLLPLGADRLACALPTHDRPLTDGGQPPPDAPAIEGGELTSRLLLIITADGHDGSCRTDTAVVPGRWTGEGWRWQEPLAGGPAAPMPLAPALTVLLDARDDLVTGAGSELRLAAQFGRVLLLGHELAIAPELADRLEVATST